MMGRGAGEEVALRRMGGSRGVREDLSEITRTLARQLRGVAAFLSPSPPPTLAPPSSFSPSTSSAAASASAATAAPSASSASPRSPSSRAMVGVRSDLAEIGGGFKTGFAALSCLLRNSADKDRGGSGGEKEVDGGSGVPGVVGVTGEVLKFVEFLSGRPEEWVQCPVPLDSDFEMSDARKKHISSVEQLVPSLAALKVRLCPSHISEGTFWKIYLFLLHPKLSEHDSELLSTLQIVEEMDLALQELRNRIIKRLENSRADAPSLATNVTTCEIEEVDTQVLGEVSVNSEGGVNAIEKENVEQWLEDAELATYFDAQKPLGSEDEAFLGDLENDDSLPGLKRLTSSSSLEVVPISSPGSSTEWYPLRRSRSGLPPRSSRPAKQHLEEQKMDGGESSDWVDAGDSDSTLG